MPPRRQWLVTVTLAEALGYFAPAITGILTTHDGWPPGRAAVAIVIAGWIEGLFLGVGQAMALPVPVRKARYALLSAAGGGAVWAVVMSMMVFADRLGGWRWLAVLAAPAGLVAIGFAQWLELRRHVARAWTWIAWTALAWVVALPLSFLPGPFVDAQTPLATHVVVWELGGIAMAFVMAAITWQGVRRLALHPKRI